VKRCLAFAICAVLAASVGACNAKETKSSQTDKKTSTSVEPRVALVPWAAGGQKPVTDKSAEGRRIMNDPEQIAAGKQLFSAMNCVGCHFSGGGGIGPPLMDNLWIYGSSIENIAATIREGRPNGMPSFRGALPDEQIWQLAAYARSLSHPTSNDTAAQDEKK
jgi:cytochrome c oxidase cbb3-type subunit III